jgi:ATP/maltotriose-dependent transcriptional regulator MalT
VLVAAAVAPAPADADAAPAPHDRNTAIVLEPHELDAMLKRTEGWPAAVSLEALALGGGGHRPAWAPPAHRADRDLVDYLTGAVLGRLPPERLAFLRRTSILDRFSAPLCDAVLDRRGSALEIAALEDSNLFVQPLDRGREWYPDHPIFRDAMRVELERAKADSVSELHLRASRWHEREGTRDEAVEHALAARDHGRARDLVVGNARAPINDGRLAAVRTWLAAFTGELIAGSAPLALSAAWVSLFHGERDRA